MAIKQKRFTIVFSGLGDRQRLVAYLPVDDKLDEKTQKIKLRQAAEWAVRKQYKDGNKASIRSVKPYMGGAYDSADSAEAIAAKYGHEMQNDAAKGGKLNEAELHKLLTKIGVAKRKIDEAEAAEKEYGQLLNSLNAIARSLSFNEKQKAKEIFKQYKNAPKILGLY